jgi:CRISPR-associated protein Csd1
MILQALARYYEILDKDPKVEIVQPNYSVENVSFALELSEDGDILALIPLFENVQRGKRTLAVNRRMRVPERVGRSGKKIAPNFLWDNSTYALGISTRDSTQPSYSRERFGAFQEFHLELLGSADYPVAQAITRFLERYDPATLRKHPVLAPQVTSILESTGNLVFLVQGEFAHQDPVLLKIWERHRAEGSSSTYAQCLITGEVVPIARLHPPIKGVSGARGGKKAIVSFNQPAWLSYNHKKQEGINSPVGEYAAFAYTAALNYLLSLDSRVVMGDTTVVYWAESDNPGYAQTVQGLFEPPYISNDRQKPGRDRKAEDRLMKVAMQVKYGAPLDKVALMEGLDPETRFYVLGLSLNNARISVRFFHADLFGNFVDRILTHYQDMEMVREFENQPAYLTVRHVLEETYAKKGKNAQPSPLLGGAILRAILTGAPYPAALYTAVLNRIRADQDDPSNYISKIGYARAAIIKACLLRKYRHQLNHSIQEVLQMSLNEESTNAAYVLGRIFAVLEKVQQEAIPGLNATIKDRYFTTACASPATVFPVLLRLAQHHIAKAEYGGVSDRRIESLLDKLDIETNPIPSTLTLDQQGVFVLGYYQQRADFYRKKDPQAEVVTTD